MDSKIIFLDMDGTTLRDDKSMPSENKEAIERVLSDGHIVAVNTGRGIHSTMLLLDEFGLSHENLYLLCFQGNLIYHPFSKKILYSDGIDRASGIEKLKDLNLSGIHAHTYGGDGIISVLDNENLREYMRITHETTVLLDSWDELLEDTIPKIIAVDFKDHDNLEAYRQKFIASGDDRFECFFSSPMYLEFTKKGTDKGVGVREFTRIMGMELSDTIAVGDEENDIPMLKTAGVGVAVKNAVLGAKEAADIITEADNEHGAVSEAINRIIYNI